MIELDRLLVALGAIHRGVEEGGHGIAGGDHADVVQAGGGGGKADADNQGDDGHDDHHLDEGDAAAGRLRSGRMASYLFFQLTMSALIPSPPGWPSAPRLTISGSSA